MKINHRRKNPPRYPDHVLNNGYPPSSEKPWRYIDKSLHGWHQKSVLADKSVGHLSIGNDFTNGHRGMAKSVRGAKKFVRSRIRFAENQATRALAQQLDTNEESEL